MSARKAAYYEARGEPVELLDAAALREAEPQLRPGLAGALRVPQRPRGLPAGGRAALPRAGPRPRRHGRARRDRRGARAEACPLRRGRWREADLVVNAAGPDAPRLTPGLPIVPRKGHLVITDRYPGFLRHQVVELGYLKSAHTLTRESVAMNVQPRRTGQLLVGSSRELVGWDASLNRGALRAHAASRDGVPAGPGAALTRCAPGSASGRRRPTSCRSSGRGRRACWIAAGHEGLGVTTAPGTARLLADLVLGRTPDDRRLALRPAARDARPWLSASASSSTAATWTPTRTRACWPRSGTPARARCARRSAATARGPLCAMGTCFECRVRVDGVPHVRACLTPVREGMRVALGARPASPLPGAPADDAPPLVGRGRRGRRRTRRPRRGRARGRGGRAHAARRHQPAAGRPDLAPPRRAAARGARLARALRAARAPRRFAGATVVDAHDARAADRARRRAAPRALRPPRARDRRPRAVPALPRLDAAGRRRRRRGAGAAQGRRELRRAAAWSLAGSGPLLARRGRGARQRRRAHRRRRGAGAARPAARVRRGSLARAAQARRRPRLRRAAPRRAVPDRVLGARGRGARRRAPRRR